MAKLNAESMTEQEKVTFLAEKFKEITALTSKIEEVFPEKSFRLDGIIVGNIVEVMTAHTYGMTLYRQSEKTYDGEVDGKKVQIKEHKEIIKLLSAKNRNIC